MVTQQDRIELLAALVQRKWRALTLAKLNLSNARSVEAANNLRGVERDAREEWAAASLLLQLAQDMTRRNPY